MDADIVPNDIYMTNVFITTRVHTGLVEDENRQQVIRFAS